MNIEDKSLFPPEFYDGTLRGFVNVQLNAFEKQYLEMRQVIEYYAAGNEWDYGMKAREILAKYGEEK